MMEELQTLAKKAVYGPFGPEDSDNASHLVGKPILWSNSKQALGSYGVLLSISSGLKPYFVQFNRMVEDKDLIYTKECGWIVFDES